MGTTSNMLLAACMPRSSASRKEGDRQWKDAKHMQVTQEACVAMLGGRILLGKDARKTRLRTANARSVAFSHCEPIRSRETMLPVFQQCRILFLFMNDPAFNACFICAESFPQLTHVYVHGSLGTARLHDMFPSQVSWTFTRNSPTCALETADRISYSDFMALLKAAGRGVRSRASTAQSRSSSSSIDRARTTRSRKRWAVRIGGRASGRRSSLVRRSSETSLCAASEFVASDFV